MWLKLHKPISHFLLYFTFNCSIFTRVHNKKTPTILAVYAIKSCGSNSTDVDRIRWHFVELIVDNWSGLSGVSDRLISCQTSINRLCLRTANKYHRIWVTCSEVCATKWGGVQLPWTVANYGIPSFWFSDFSSFYRAMHYSAKRGLPIACRLSVCLWRWWIVYHIGWNSSNIISRLVSEGRSLSADLNIMDLLQGE